MYIRNRYSRDLAQVIGCSVFLVLILIVDIIYSGRIRLVVGGLVGFGIVLQIGAFYREHGIGRINRRLIIDSVVVLLVFVVLAYLIVALFPADIVSNGSTTNIFAHGIGFLFGVLVSTAVLVMDSD